MYLKILPPQNARGSHFLRIPTSKTAAMRIILETVQRGSRYYTSGVVAARKAVALADKFAELYEVDANSNRRAYRKRQGLANCTLIMYPHDNKPGHFLWWLLVTPGKGPVHQREQLSDAHDKRQRLPWSEQYQLVRLQKVKGQGGARSWTWQLQPRAFDEWQAGIEEATRSTGQVGIDVVRVKSLLNALLCMPGYHGIREQQKQLLMHAYEHWGKHRRQPFPVDVGHLPYIDKSFACYADPALRLDGLVRIMLSAPQHLSTSAPQHLSTSAPQHPSTPAPQHQH